MAQILVRGLDEAVVAELKSLAQRHHRSLQKEVQAILEEAARRVRRMHDARKAALALRRRLGRTKHPDSVALIRADRER